jgi:HEAT repeat protein
MALPRAFKTDESFLEKIAMGAAGTRRTFEDLTRQGHRPMELERGSMSFKIWKAIKIKRVRVPDLLCLGCGHRVESRAKTKLEITMSHSRSLQERGWDFGLDDQDHVALVLCVRNGPNPIDWVASELVQYVPVGPLREAFRANQVKTVKAKGAQEGFEVRVTWPAAVAAADGVVESVEDGVIRYRKAATERAVWLQLRRRGDLKAALLPLVRAGEAVRESQILASVVPVSSSYPCPGGANVGTYVALSHSVSLSDRYAAVKALGRCEDAVATEALLERVRDEREHVYVRVDAAAGLLRSGHAAGAEFLETLLHGEYLENRLEVVIVLGELGGPAATRLLLATLGDAGQDAEIRAGAAWSLGEVRSAEALPALVASFRSLETVIKVEAARAMAKLARGHLAPVVDAFSASRVEERPGVAWALSKAGGFSVAQLLPMLTDEDARQWVAYMIGTQAQEALLPQIEALAERDREVYFAVTVLWKILASWVYGLEEY